MFLTAKCQGFLAGGHFCVSIFGRGVCIVTYEHWQAVSCIVTPEAGSVVRDGIEGFVVPSRDTVALADRIICLYRDRKLLKNVRFCPEKAEAFS